MKEYNILVFGSLPIATKIVKYINSIPNFNLLGVVIGDENPNDNDPWTDELCLGEYARINNIKKLELDELVNLYSRKEIDLGLSCRFSKIIRKPIIDLFSKGIINMHGGWTLHYVDEGIDTGDIIRRCEFEIEEIDTGYSVFQKTQLALYNNMVEIIPLVLNNQIKCISMKELVDKGYKHRYFNKKSILDYKEINNSDFETGDILYKIRAFDFPGYEPAYYKFNGKKIYMRMSYKEDE